MRLYIGWLHNNKLNIGMDMASVMLPYMEFQINPHNFANQEIPLEFQQFNQSSLLAYLGIRGIASPVTYEGFKYAYAAKQALSLTS